MYLKLRKEAKNIFEALKRGKNIPIFAHLQPNIAQLLTKIAKLQTKNSQI